MFPLCIAIGRVRLVFVVLWFSSDFGGAAPAWPAAAHTVLVTLAAACTLNKLRRCHGAARKRGREPVRRDREL